MPIWDAHFTNIVNRQRMNEAHERTRQYKDIRRFTTEEIGNTIYALKNKNAAGPDAIFNKHIKAAPSVLIPAITEMMNLCSQD